MDNKIANHDEEMGLIGAVLRDPSRYADLYDVIDPTDFDWHCYGWVWTAFEKLRVERLRIDTITVGDMLEREGNLGNFQVPGGQFTGRAALSRIREEGHPESAESYARIVKDYSAKRLQLELLNKAAGWVLNGRTADDIKNDLAQRLENIPTYNGRKTQHTQTMADAVSDAYDYTGRAADGQVVCVPTELIDLDSILGGGLYAPGLYLIAGRPGQGKSAFLTTVAKNAADKTKRVAVFSLEMANREVAQRLIAMESGVPTDRQRSGKLEEGEWPKYTHAVEVLSSLPITLNDMPAISPNEMRQVLRKIGKVDLVIVDYIQLQRPDVKQANRYQEVDEISRGLKWIAKEFDVPVLAAAQLSRAVEQRAEKRPVLSDLRESGGLEQESDVVMFIYRPDQYDKDVVKNKTEIIVAKQRNGQVGSVELVYRPTVTKFENAAKHV